MTPQAPKLEALIFDVDGTLVDTEELHRRAYNQTFVEFGFGWEWNAGDYAKLLAVSGGQARIAHYIDLIDLPPSEKIRLRRLIPAIHEEKTRLYSELIAGNAVRPRPGIARLIEEARRANVRVGLVASSASVTVESLVSSALGRELRNAIAAIACGDMVARRKPAPDMYELVLTQLRVSPSNTVAFEDSANGLEAARAVGLYTIITPSPWTIAHNFLGADLLLSSLGDPDRPLDELSAAKIGAPCLGLTQIEKLRSSTIPALRVRIARP